MMMEEMALAVLWFDEIEMGITSTESSGEQAAFSRAFFLTRMQEKACDLSSPPLTVHRPCYREMDPQGPLR